MPNISLKYALISFSLLSLDNVIFVDILLTFCGNSAITRYVFETPTKSLILLIGYFFASRSLNEI
jgi:hypothetical protein